MDYNKNERNQVSPLHRELLDEQEPQTQVHPPARYYVSVLVIFQFILAYSLLQSFIDSIEISRNWNS